jgi:signal transduction histidine kinase/DNA-binding NarL/FixJ family response regulator
MHPLSINEIIKISIKKSYGYAIILASICSGTVFFILFCYQSSVLNSLIKDQISMFIESSITSFDTYSVQRNITQLCDSLKKSQHTYVSISIKDARGLNIAAENRNEKIPQWLFLDKSFKFLGRSGDPYEVKISIFPLQPFLILSLILMINFILSASWINHILNIIQIKMKNATFDLASLVDQLGTLGNLIETGEDTSTFKITPMKSNIKETILIRDAIQIFLNKIVDYKNNLVMTQEKMIALEKTSAVSLAIAQVTQMLAHDVRKPFTMLKVGIEYLKSIAHHPHKFRQKINLMILEVNKALTSVDGILEDVMEIGAPQRELTLEQIMPEEIIESTLHEIFSVYPQAQVEFFYDFQHESMIKIHVQKVRRIFTNILANALQAVNYNGSIWFKTEIKDDFIQFTLGNDRSFIPLEIIPKLFDSFFTSDKKGGTGLGLAIAQKVVNAHGGKIWCESVKNDIFPLGKVEFFFTLPLDTPSKIAATTTLPRYSTDITQSLNRFDVSEEFNNKNLRIPTLQAELVNKIVDVIRTGTTLKILIIDDEHVYRDALAEWIKEVDTLHEKCRIFHAENSPEGIDLIRKNKIDLIITDIDFGSNFINGLELVKVFRDELEFKGTIIVHSNRIQSSDFQNAFRQGANGFLPKPMAKGQLLKLILQTCQNIRSEIADSTVKSDKVEDLKEIAHIEDDIFYREFWQKQFGHIYRLHQFKDPSDFTLKISQDRDFLSKLSLIVTDFYFDGSDMTGIDIGTLTKSLRPELPVYLSSNGKFKKENIKGVIDQIIPKEFSSQNLFA